MLSQIKPQAPDTGPGRASPLGSTLLRFQRPGRACPYRIEGEGCPRTGRPAEYCGAFVRALGQLLTSSPTRPFRDGPDCNLSPRKGPTTIQSVNSRRVGALAPSGGVCAPVGRKLRMCHCGIPCRCYRTVERWSTPSTLFGRRLGVQGFRQSPQLGGVAAYHIRVTRQQHGVRAATSGVIAHLTGAKQSG